MLHSETVFRVFNESHLLNVRVKNKKLVANHLTLITVNLQTPEFMRNKLNFASRMNLLVADQR